MKREDILISVAKPAPWPRIVLYVFTLGKLGELYRAKQKKASLWTQPDNFNCRCALVNLNDTGDKQ